ncbi:hypothetical protein E5288_WYG011874 [Bos mutus]|uniref:Uncharacterized protein n=1 Tax=Bos mutus TaxID=72004 RepID=A0A6B0QYB5_9CETA|nr:hypothetical protein [Bos mutus]
MMCHHLSSDDTQDLQSMAGCGLSEDTFFSSFFYNYGSSWETPSNQVWTYTIGASVLICVGALCRALKTLQATKMPGFRLNICASLMLLKERGFSD